MQTVIRSSSCPKENKNPTLWQKKDMLLPKWVWQGIQRIVGRTQEQR